MKKLFIIANWKSNKNTPEAKTWFQGLPASSLQPPASNKEIIICPPLTLLPMVKSYIADNQLPFYLGAQDVSPFESGAYTGEVNAGQLKEFADYVLVGHSERRINFKEDEKMIAQKITQAQKANLVPILCISRLEQISNSEFRTLNSQLLIAYEPLSAIGSGSPATPEDAQKVAQEIKKELGEIPVLYGGSVNAENVKSFTEIPEISGVLVGQESLEAQEFLKIIFNA